MLIFPSRTLYSNKNLVLMPRDILCIVSEWLNRQNRELIQQTGTVRILFNNQCPLLHLIFYCLFDILLPLTLSCDTVKKHFHQVLSLQFSPHYYWIFTTKISLEKLEIVKTAVYKDLGTQLITQTVAELCSWR